MGLASRAFMAWLLGELKMRAVQRYFKAIPVILFLVMACGRPQTEGEATALTGKASVSSGALLVPEAKSPGFLQSLKRNLGLLLHGVGKLGNAAGSFMSARARLAETYYQASSQAGGIPREQGEILVKSLVSPESQACGGESCARVLGIDEKAVPEFFDDMLAQAGSSKALATKEGVRDRVVASLMPHTALVEPTSVRDKIASLYKQRARPTPSQSPEPKEIVTPSEAEEKAGFRYIRAVYDFTTKMDYHFIRRVETTSRDVLLQEGMNVKDIDKWLQKSKIINDGLKKLPVVRATVYRGLQNLTDEDISVWIDAWKSGRPIGLGFGEKPATTSSSWHIYSATSFITQHLLLNRKTKNFAVILEIRDHRGVSIQNLSAMSSEFEVLLPRDQTVKIQSIVPLEGAPRTFIIKMRGVPTAYLHEQAMGSFRRAA